MKNPLKYIGLILILFIIGFLLRDYFFNLSISQITNDRTQVVSRKLSGQFLSHITFALSIGILPILYLIIKKVTKLNFIHQGLISCLVIIGCGILLWQFRIFHFNHQAQYLSDLNIGNGIKLYLDHENLNFEVYLFTGFIVGTVLSILIFKNRAKHVA